MKSTTASCLDKFNTTNSQYSLKRIHLSITCKHYKVLTMPT